MLYCYVYFFFDGYGDHRDLPLLTHSFPTRRSSDLAAGAGFPSPAQDWQDDAISLIELLRLDRATRSGLWRVAAARSGGKFRLPHQRRSEEHTSELQSLMRNSYAVFCLKNKTQYKEPHKTHYHNTLPTMYTIS